MEIKNFEEIISSTGFDIIYQERIYSNDKIVQSAELTIEYHGKVTRIKFELANGNEIDENDFLFIPETNFLFFRGNIEWCAFDLTNNIIARRENATQLPFIERRNCIVLIYDEIYVESVDLKAKQIDNVPIDPPTKSIEYNDKIEFDSPVFGKQILNLKK